MALVRTAAWVIATIALPRVALAGDILTIGMGDGWVLPLRIAPAQISISNSAIADIKLIGDKRLLVNAKKLGQARVILIDRVGRVRNYLVNVVIPISGLATRLNRVLPGQTVKVQAVGDTLVLTGEVDSPRVAQRVSNMAGAHLRAMGVTGVKVFNYMAVRGKQQVQLRVKVAEVSRSMLRAMGVNGWHRGRARAGGLLGPGVNVDDKLAPNLGSEALQANGAVPVPEVGKTPLAPLPVITPPIGGNAFNVLFSQASGAFPISVALSLLQDEGLVKVLSEPTVVAYSGQEASFLAGGELPVPIPQGAGQVGIEYKKYGVQLSFTPVILGKKNIRMKVSVSVSEQDPTNGIQLDKFKVPALATRHSETTVHLEAGHSFAIAGLLQDRTESSKGKVPLLGDIPILGMLFRRVHFKRIETELIIVVTAELVNPVPKGEVPPLPGERELADPGALRFFLLGTTDARDKIPGSGERGPAGPVGFAAE